jgi:U4/U6 small nuclear ribonucleoprotein PRP3
MTGKRPYESPNDDDGAKRQRALDGSPMPVSEAESKKAATAAKIAALKAKMAAKKPQAQAQAAQSPSPAPAAPLDDVAAKKAETQRKIDEFKAKMAAKQQQATAPPREMSEQERWRAEAVAKAAELAKSRNATTTPTKAK